MDTNYLYPTYQHPPFPSAQTTSTSKSTPIATPFATPTLPTLTATTTGPSTPDASSQLDIYPYHLFPPFPHLPPPLSSLASAPSEPLTLPDPSLYSKRSPTRLSTFFPPADIVTMASSSHSASTSPPSTSANPTTHAHHQSQPHLFPEQIHSSGNAEPSGGASNPTATDAITPASAAAYRPPSSTANHASSPYQTSTGLAGGGGGQPPALQATHPSADIYRHRSASPWVSQHQQQQYLHQQHHSPLHSSMNYPDTSNTYHASTNHALSMFNNNTPNQSYVGASHSQHPLSISHTSIGYSFPPVHSNNTAAAATTTHYSNNASIQHDSYHSPSQQRAILPYGYPIHSQMYSQHNNSTSSLLDKHLTTSDLRSSTSNNITNSGSLVYYGSGAYNSNNSIKSTARYSSTAVKAEPYGQISRTNRTISSRKASSSTGQAKITTPSTTAGSKYNTSSSNNSKSATLTEHQESGSSKLVNASATMAASTIPAGTGTGTGTSTAGGSGSNTNTSMNHGIIDESNTTLWDLKDGPDGPRGKPRKFSFIE